MTRFVPAILGLCALVGGLAAYLSDRPEPTAAAPQQPADQKKVALYCQFYVFVESRPFVAFMLEQSPDDPSRYRQTYVAKADGDRTDYNALADRWPDWRLVGQSDPPRIEARVMVPDAGQAGIAEQDIAIELREFDAARADGVWREASLKSVYYQNLPGKCRQAPMRDPGQGAGGASSAATILPTEASRSLTASASERVRI